MRLSELLHCDVVAADGQRLGRVMDLRLVQDGPILEGFGAALRAEALIVGRRAVGTRLGYGRRDLYGPKLLNAVFERLDRQGYVVPIDDVEDLDARPVRLRVPADQVRRVGDA